jgi:hypothetical protein
VDGTAAFVAFFQSSDAGGNFLVRALFPISGDTARIASVQAAITNSAGTATTARVSLN